jgi:hypothetical protein
MPHKMPASELEDCQRNFDSELNRDLSAWNYPAAAGHALIELNEPQATQAGRGERQARFFFVVHINNESFGRARLVGDGNTEEAQIMFL